MPALLQRRFILDKIRVGMVGLGGVGTWGHLPGYEQIPDDAKLVAFCDVKLSNIEKPAKRHGAKYTRTTTIFSQILKLIL
ncbi:MAG: hypothetical protein ACHQ1H_01085 [Nitrososphaerales archaeon]